tara:strand:+ start:1719 stop:1850 length:132 start_codon:yes stop_codon:yes gene_type:complete
VIKVENRAVVCIHLLKNKSIKKAMVTLLTMAFFMLEVLSLILD